MPVLYRARPPQQRRSRRSRSRLCVEALESRSVPSGTSGSGPLIEAETNDTLDLAHDVGDLSATSSAEVLGTIGNSSAAADVDWYSFTLTGLATVHLTTLDPQDASFAAVLSLYNNAVDVFDPYVSTGHRLLAQAEGSPDGSGASLTQLLAPGTYYVAVSGLGNRYFHPFLADSGAEGLTGEYALVLTATDLQPAPAGPVMVSADPADGAVLERSPFMLRLAFDGSPDFSAIAPGVNVTLTYNPAGTFGDGNDQDIPLIATYSATASELQLLPVSAMTFGPQPLLPGSYRLFLAQDSSTLPLAEDYLATFQINGSEGRTEPNAQADDTPGTARDLGDVTSAGLIQIAGAVGDDSAYDPANADPFLTNPAADVDLYHFQITGSDGHALIVQVSAGSIGYGFLDPAVSLFRVNAADGQLQRVAVNDNSLNDTAATNGSMPLSNDAVLFSGLPAGDYYLAVSGAGNVPDPVQGLDPGTGGVFDPTVSHSGLNGFTMGNYVLSLLVHSDNEPPQVEAVSLPEDDDLDAPPTQFTVQFSEPVNLRQLAYQQFWLTQQGELNGVFVHGADGVDYYPRLVSYDTTTNQAEFLMLDRLPNGVNELHLSGSLGLADLAGNALIGNDAQNPTNDHVVAFTVQGPVAGSNGNPLLWLDQEPNDVLAQPQQLGVLFPHELQTGVTLKRDFTNDPAGAPSDTADYYQFEVLQSRGYFFALTGSGLPTGTRPELFTAAGNAVFTTGGAVRLAYLTPGTYFVRVVGWTAVEAANVTYQLRITLGGSQENPTPLTAGPAPAYRLRFRLPSGGGGENDGGGDSGTGDGGGGSGSNGNDPGSGGGSGNPGGNGGDNGGGSGSPGSGGSGSPPSVPPAPGGATEPPRLILPGSDNLGGEAPPAPAPAVPVSTRPSMADIPATLLSVLSDLPVGGLRGLNPSTAPPPVDRLVLGEPQGASGDGPIKSAAADQDRAAPSSGASSAPSASTVPESGASSAPSASTVLEEIFAAAFRALEKSRQEPANASLGGPKLAEWLLYWLRSSWKPLLIPALLPGNNSREGDSGDWDALETEALSSAADRTADASAVDLVWALGMVAAGEWATRNSDKTRRYPVHN